MNMTMKDLIRLVREGSEETVDPIDADHPSDIHAQEDSWAGGPNIHLNVDFPKTVGGDAVVTAPETLNIVGESSYDDAFIDDIIHEALKSVYGSKF